VALASNSFADSSASMTKSRVTADSPSQIAAPFIGNFELLAPSDDELAESA
jgi:hypothetical protein